MKERAYEAGIRPVDVLLTSAKKSHEMTELLEKIEEYRDGRDVYIVGVTKCRKIDAYQSNHQKYSGSTRCNHNFAVSRNDFG